MNLRTLQKSQILLIGALVLLIIGLLFGILASLSYVLPSAFLRYLPFSMFRPLHVSSVQFWILLGASGAVCCGTELLTGKKLSSKLSNLQVLLWAITVGGVFTSYARGEMGGREYWEFNPVWALPLAGTWLVMLVNFLKTLRGFGAWPVYVWMWMTGIIFFLFAFSENYLWLFPYVREQIVKDITLQWKVNGSLVGSWNQLIYGSSFFLMSRITGDPSPARSRMAFAMYFLGLGNLMFNWGHHIYSLPTAPYVRYLGYGVSMTEWIIFIRIMRDWRRTISDLRKFKHYFPYRFLVAAEFWVFLNLFQALLMSVPAINLYTHGTHITVAHAMGTTIGINTMILLAACFEFLVLPNKGEFEPGKIDKWLFWISQIALLVFWLCLNVAGVKKAVWQMSSSQLPFSGMMEGLHFWFWMFVLAGLVLAMALSTIAARLVWQYTTRCFWTQGTQHNPPTASDRKVDGVGEEVR